MKTKTLAIIAVSLFTLFSCKKENEKQVLEEDRTIDYVQEPQEEVQIPQIDSANAPVLVLSQEVYDLGDVKAGETVEKKITFKNEGKSPLIIKQAKSSCGCTIPEFSDKPIGVGEEGELLVKYSVPSVNGQQTKTVTLLTNTVNQTELFKIKAMVVGGENGNKRNLPTPNL